MDILPTKIERQPSAGLSVSWNDGSSCQLTAENLRRNCPCAECQEKRGETRHSKPLIGKRSALRVIESTAEESLTLLEVWSIGNYAIGIRWGDGHSSGIYSWPVLRALGNL